MEIYTVKNDSLTIKIKSAGAEIISIQDADNNELIWQADANIWGRHAPVLFPIVGRLNCDHYYFDDTRYDMSQHGFARDNDFHLVSKSDTKLVLALEDDPQTFIKYPFHFKLQIVYQLVKDALQVSYIVENTDTQEIYFSIGAHPGFSVPFVPDLNFEDFNVKVEPKEARYRIALKDSNIDLSHEQKIDDQDFALTHEAFKDDAIIYNLNKPAMITIESEKTDHKITLDTGNAKFVGIWSQYPEKGDFVCIEPWWGIADKIDSDHQLVNKYGINSLDPQEKFEAYYSMSFTS